MKRYSYQIDHNQANNWIIQSLKQVPIEEQGPELNFQSHFFKELSNSQAQLIDAPEEARLQTQLEKSEEFHGMHRAPDIVFHIPRGITGDQTIGNFIVIQLKYNKFKQRILDDLEILGEFKQMLRYQVGYLIHTASNGRTYLDKYSVDNSNNWQNGFLHEMSFWFENETVKLTHLFVDSNGDVIIEDYSD